MNEEQIRKISDVSGLKPKPVTSINDLSVSDRLVVEQTARIQAAIEVVGIAILNCMSHQNRSEEETQQEIATRLFQQEQTEARIRDSIVASLRT